MLSYTRNECTLDVIFVVEFSKNGMPLNWCKYLLNELLQACAYAHEKSSYLSYGYLLVSLAMWKWKPPSGHDVSFSFDGHLAMLFKPWHGHAAQSIPNEHTFTFSQWYSALVATTQWPCIPQNLLRWNTPISSSEWPMTIACFTIWKPTQLSSTWIVFLSI